MLHTKFTTAYWLSAIIAILATVASAGGLFIDDLYRDNAWSRSQFYGNDIVTLVVAVPVLTAALLLAGRGSQRAQLVWLGMMHYMLYNYAFYLFGAAFNWFFLIYAALFALSILGLIFALPNMNANEISQKFQASTPVKWISGYMFFVAVCLGGLWIALSLGFVFTGQVPQVITDSGHVTSVVFAVDLPLLVPYFVLAAIWLWQRQPWGFVLGTIINVSGAAYTLALAAMGITADKAVVAGATMLIPLWLLLTVASVVAAGLLLGNMQQTDLKGLKTQHSPAQ